MLEEKELEIFFDRINGRDEHSSIHFEFVTSRLSASRNTMNIVDKYFNLNRTLLLIIGLWPYEKSKFARLQIICIYGILTTSIIFQLTTIVTSKFSAECILKVLSVVMAFSSSIIKYNAFYVNSETVKYLMEQIQDIYNDLRDNNEFDIVEKYGNNAKRYTTWLAIFIVCSLSVFLSAQLWTDFIEIVLSKNVSRSHHLSTISTEYFIDQEKYFYLPLLHINASISISCYLIIATGTLLIAYSQHACGMFKIASFRIKKAIHVYIPKIANRQNEILVHKHIVRAVNIHRKAITFSNDLITRFEKTFLFLIITGVLTLSLNVFRIVLDEYNTEELLMCLIFAFMSILYMFVANLVGQQIIDHNNHVFVTAYKVRWYITPLAIQKLMLLLLQRGNKSFGLNVAGLFTASLECFATLINAAVSYFAIMYSMQS